MPHMSTRHPTRKPPRQSNTIVPDLPLQVFDDSGNLNEPPHLGGLKRGFRLPRK